jgi:hypothetical protein
VKDPNGNGNEGLIRFLQAAAELEAAKWFTRPGLAAAVQVSVCSVDRMTDSGEISRVRVRRRVRFYWADVVEALGSGNRKFGRAAELTAESAKIAEGGQAR